MTDQSPPRSGVAAVIVAAGAGLRAGQPVPKQFALWRGKPVVRHSAEALAAAGISPIVVAIPAGADDVAGAALAGIAGVRLVTGGATRQESVRRTLWSSAGSPLKHWPTALMTPRQNSSSRLTAASAAASRVA